jgi:hypothetical protein
VFSDDLLLRALAQRVPVDADSAASLEAVELPAGALADLRRETDLARLQNDWIVPALSLQRANRCGDLVLDCADGVVLSYRRAHRWRLWRRPARAMA